MLDFRYGRNYTTVIWSTLAAIAFIKTNGSKIRCKPIYSKANQPTKKPKQTPNPVIYKTLSLIQLMHSSMRTMRGYIKPFARLKKASIRWKALYSGSTLTISKTLKLWQLFETSSGSLAIICYFQTKHGCSQTETVFQPTLQRTKKEKKSFLPYTVKGKPTMRNLKLILCFYTEIPRKEGLGNKYNEQPRSGL